MPLYEFRCNECGAVFDRIQKMDAPEPECPECSGSTKKLISASNFELKGTGWYKTDFKGNK